MINIDLNVCAHMSLYQKSYFILLLNHEFIE